MGTILSVTGIRIKSDEDASDDIWSLPNLSVFVITPSFFDWIMKVRKYGTRSGTRIDSKNN